MRIRLFAAVTIAFLPLAAQADRIYLENGKSFDDVVLVAETATEVRFLVASGEMTLPRSWVERVERVPGALEQYIARQRALAADPEASAGDYLALARWARVQNLDHGFRESLMTAAEFDPTLKGLAPLMASLGYSFDPEGEIWVRGQGAAQRAVAARTPAPEPRRSEGWGTSSDGTSGRVAEGLTRAIETLARAELEKSRASRDRRPARAVTVERTFLPVFHAPLAVAQTGWVFPGVPLRPAGQNPSDPVIRNPANPYARALLSRLPGSLLPVSAHRH